MNLNGLTCLYMCLYQFSIPLSSKVSVHLFFEFPNDMLSFPIPTANITMISLDVIEEHTRAITIFLIRIF